MSKDFWGHQPLFYSTFRIIRIQHCLQKLLFRIQSAGSIWVWTVWASESSLRPAISPDLGLRLPAFSLLYWLSNFHKKIFSKIIKFSELFFFLDNILKFTDKINWLKRQLRSHFTANSKQINGRSRLQKTTDRLIAAGVKHINSLAVNLWCDNKLQITISEVLISRSSKHTKDTFDQKSERKRNKLVENF